MQDIPKATNLEELRAILHSEMKSEGLETANVQRLQEILAAYQSSANDWQKYAMFDEGRYTRNLVDDGNGKFNLMILCWAKGARSPIHDHANAHCLLKVLDGQLVESLYDWPEDRRDSKLSPEEGTCAVNLRKESVFETDQVTYMHDNIGLHRISNETDKGSVSLHLYSPPFQYCKTFCEKTGQARSSGKCVFFSINGEKNNYIEDLDAKQFGLHCASPKLARRRI